ncbi:hypothetical protein TSUD_47580 [Trifolium subterraneum]|nr:hypothetical protein TSUD_47580 [Trifolium subterraneum]
MAVKSSISIDDDEGHIKRTGGVQYKYCGMAQYTNLIGCTIGYTLTAAISMV